MATLATSSSSNSSMRYNNSLRKKSSIYMDQNNLTMNNNNNNSINNSSASLNCVPSPFDYSVTDVYDDAAVIGAELEKIINNYGPDVLKSLMPKVISVLELLESLTLRKESEADELNELRMRCQSLETERLQRISEKEKFEKELEEIEEKWKQETLKLINMINRLKEENKRLNEAMAEFDEQSQNVMQNEQQIVIKQEELDYIKQIKEENIKLKETLRFKEKEIEQKNSDNEGFQSQIDRLSSTILNFRRKQILAQNQIEKMAKTKAELECRLAEKDQQLFKLRETIYSKALTNSLHSNDESKTAKKPDMSTSNVQANTSLVLNDAGKYIIYDEKDPNRPRFTRKELEKVLLEKNELTIKLDQTQDELELLRRHETMQYGDVQGPINKEPDEKLDNPKPINSVSGIRRFINNIGTTTTTNDEQTNEHENSHNNNLVEDEQNASSNGHVFIA